MVLLYKLFSRLRDKPSLCFVNLMFLAIYNIIYFSEASSHISCMAPSDNTITNINSMITRQASFEIQFVGIISTVFEIDIKSHSSYTC